MKTLVVYDSSFGNTKKVAEETAKVLEAKVVSVKEFKKDDLSEVNVLILGSPIIGWKPTVSTQAFLDKFEAKSLEGVKATTFDTRVKLFIHGDAMGKMAVSLKNLGANIFTEPMAFYVAGPQNAPYLLDGELEKAKGWAEKIAALRSQ